ncbi:MAG TPA: hypothetical protein VMF52_16470 [Steroidobacteraceae bacterium]|nr:hypothetical protein [Steroidobacteraceae bacterium]
MSEVQTDPLVAELLSDLGVPERVNYAAGVLLDDEDFSSEQQYLRGRLARALAALYGFGTVAGLGVSCATADNPEREVKVAPGLALDRLGRLIEVRREQCLRLVPWFAWQATQGAARVAELIAARVDDPDNAGRQRVFLDVSLRFAICPHGKTPAFASGPFDATDYVVTSRLADAFEITLDLAPLVAGAPLAPQSSLPALDDKLGEIGALPADQRAAARRRWAVDSALSAWPGTDPADASRLPKLREQRRESDWLLLLLARVAVPIDQAAPSAPLLVDTTRDVVVDNYLRPVVFNPLRWQGT